MNKITQLSIIIVSLSFLIGCGNPRKADGTDSTIKIIEVRNKAFEGRLKKLEEEFNAIQFKQGSAILPENASYPLHQLGILLKQNPEYKLAIIGHTSAEGSVNGNQKLSEARAKSVYEFLTQDCHIKESRLSYEGKGSSELVDNDHPNSPINRRTEFKILK